MNAPKDSTGGCCPPSPCSADLIQRAWEEYHGPITDESGEEYIPAMPPAFMRGFADGYEQGKRSREIIGSEAVRAMNDAAELLAEIMRDEVNHQDEAEKWLRAYAPQYLANDQAYPRIPQ